MLFDPLRQIFQKHPETSFQGYQVAQPGTSVPSLWSCSDSSPAIKNKHLQFLQSCTVIQTNKHTNTTCQCDFVLQTCNTFGIMITLWYITTCGSANDPVRGLWCYLHHHFGAIHFHLLKSHRLLKALELLGTKLGSQDLEKVGMCRAACLTKKHCFNNLFLDVYLVQRCPKYLNSRVQSGNGQRTSKNLFQL